MSLNPLLYSIKYKWDTRYIWEDLEGELNRLEDEGWEIFSIHVHSLANNGNNAGFTSVVRKVVKK